MSDLIQEKLADGTLVGWWDFRAGHIDDLSGNSNDGSFASSPVFSKASLRFDGVDDAIAMGNVGITDYPFTLVAAYRESDTTSDQILISVADASSGFYHALALIGGDISLRYYDAFPPTDLMYVQNKQEWHVVVGVWAAVDDRKLYVDGIERNSDNVSIGPIVTDSLKIGVSADSTPYGYFNGVISTGAVFDTTLTATEIAQLTVELRDMVWPGKITAQAKAKQLIRLGYITGELNPLGVWDMKPAGGGIPDLAPGGNDLTVYGQPVYGHSLLGYSARLTDSVNRFETTDAIDTNWLTISAWIWLDGWGGNNTGRIFDNGKCIFRVDGVNARLVFSSDGGVTEAVSANDSLALGRWIHVCASRGNGGAVNLYVDSALSGGADQASGTPVAASTALVIGNNAAANRALEGMIVMPSTRLYNATAAQVTALYAKGAEVVQFKTDWFTRVSDAAVASGQLEDTPWQVDSGTWKISTDIIDGETVKVIECVTAGTIYIPVDGIMTQEDAAYGTWEAWAYKDDTADVLDLVFVADTIGGLEAGGQDGYGFRYKDVDDGIYMYETTAGALNELGHFSGITPVGSWYHLHMDRRYDGLVSMWVGDDSGVGSAYGTAHTTGTYICITADAGCKVAIADTKGGHAFTKYLGVI